MKSSILLAIVIFLFAFTSILIIIGYNNENTEKVIIQMTAEQFKYAPSVVNVSYGDELILNITSIDITHGFQLDEYNIYNVIIPAGESVQISFTANIKGEFKFYCTVLCGTGHSEHFGILNVR